MTFVCFKHFIGIIYSLYTKKKLRVVERVEIEKKKKTDMFSFSSKLFLKEKQIFL